MRETVSELRQLIFIYCLERRPDGSYVALNRRYQPVGFSTVDRVEYEAFPIAFKFKAPLSERDIAALSHNGDTSAERIFLYNDGCIPTSSAADWQAYSARLELLARLKVVH